MSNLITGKGDVEMQIGAQKRTQATEPLSATGEQPSIVACLGSSSTAGKGQAFNWISELERRSGNNRFRFLNFGVGGDLAYNTLERLQGLIVCRPEKVVVWVGANDVLAVVSPKVRRFFRLTKYLPMEPSLEWFQMNLRAIVGRLKKETSASIGLCSLSPIGENPTSDDPFQSRLNKLMTEYSATIKDVSLQENVSYIALHETMLDQIRASPGRALTSFRFLPFYRDAFRTLVLGKSPDEVGRMNGWRFHTDGVHLNSRGGTIAANLIEEFIYK